MRESIALHPEFLFEVVISRYRIFEKARREFAKQLLAIFGSGDSLVETKINLVSSVDAALLVEGRSKLDFGAVLSLNGICAGAEFGHGRAEGPEVVNHGLVDENVAAPKAHLLPAGQRRDRRCAIVRVGSLHVGAPHGSSRRGYSASRQ